MTLATVTLTGFYTDGQGNPLRGLLQFSPSAALNAGPDRRSLPQAQVSVQLPASGRFSAPLYATDNADIIPAGWSWNVQERLDGIPGAAPWSFFLPSQATAFAATNASPCVFTAAGTWTNGTGVQLAGGSLPGGFSAATTYYVTAAGSGTFELAAAAGGSPLGSSSSGSGTVTVVQQDISAVAVA